MVDFVALSAILPPQLFKVFKNSSNLGWNQNFYSAILKTTGDLIVLCDQDDVWLPDRIQSQVDSIRDNLIDVCSSWYWKNDLSLTPRFSESGSLGQIVFFPLHCGHQMMMTNRIKEYIPIGIHADMAHDRFLSIVGIYLGGIHASRELLVKWRRHGDNTTGELITDKRVTGKQKVVSCLKSLLLKKKSPVLLRGYNKYYEVLNELNRYSGVHPKGKRMARLMKLLRDQSLFGYLRASLIVVAERADIFQKCRTGIKDLYFDLTFVYRYWFEHQYDI